MLKARKDNIIILGLSDVNVTKMKMDQPIRFNLRSLGADLPDLIVYIIHGKDEKVLKDLILPMMGPDIKVEDSSNTQFN